MFCVSRYFRIVRNLSREPHFWAENRIFKNFSKSLKTCLVGVFWVFQSIFRIVRHLGRERDFWAENRIFKNFLKSLKTCLVGVFCVLCFKVFQNSSKSEPRTTFLSREPDFQEFLKKPQNMFNWCFLSVLWFFLALFDIWAEKRIFEPRTVFSKHFLKA